MNKFTLSLLALVAALALSQAALADTITGSLSGTQFGSDTVTWTATSVTLTSLNEIFATGSAGDLLPITLSNTTIAPITFTFPSGPPDTLSTSGTPNESFTVNGGGETATFTFTSLSIVSETPYGTNGDSVHLEGLGDLTLAGGPTTGPTVALFSLVATEEGGSTSYTFDLTSPAPPTTVTPEPSSLLFLGSGLLGMAFVVFRKGKSTQSNMITNL